LRIEWLEPLAARFEIKDLAPGAHPVEEVRESGSATVADARAWLDSVLELSLPIAALGVRPRDRVSFQVQLWEGGRPIETVPQADAVRLDAPDESFDPTPWSP
jgi:hypothetical protein